MGLSDSALATIIAAFLLFLSTCYGHWKLAKTSGDKTVSAVRDEISKVRTELKSEIQSVRDDVLADRMDSKAADQEMHAELLMFKQENTAATDLIKQEVSSLRRATEKHNSVIERVYKLEEASAVQAEQIRSLSTGGK